MSTIELTKTIRELKDLQLMAEEVQAEITALQDTIKQEMTAKGVDEMVVDVFKVRWTPVTNHRFDSTAFRATHKDLYSQYTKETETRRFSIA